MKTKPKHICGSECSWYCCHIEGHEYADGVCERCGDELYDDNVKGKQDE